MKKIIVVFVVLLIAAVAAAAKEGGTSEPNAAMLQKRAADEAKLPLEKTIDLGSEVNMVLVFIPAGEFDMGSPPTELKRGKDEGRHHIKLTKPFYMGKFEVTQLQYRVIMNENPSKFGGDNLPVENVDWYQTSRFIKKLSDKTGLKLRLPTEAEWEYTCRAGTTTAFNTGTTLDSDFANYDAREPYADGLIGKYLGRTTDVGSYQPNAFGLYDMHGNVWEWCSDFYAENYYKLTASIDPKGPVSAKRHVIRGGAWDAPAYKCRSADRNCRKPTTNETYIGFRVVLDIEQ
jgi:formylglycine-generating enzyme required for sulfatase activity